MILTGFAAAACAHNWTPVCDKIAEREAMMMPFMIGALVLILIVGVVLTLIPRRPRRRNFGVKPSRPWPRK